ncbi:MAG: ABC transporter permease [Fretibacterium sp.]|nr:ABC transporter permease [Fretibacterium sp.]
MQLGQGRANLWETLKSKYAIFLVLVVLFIICSLLNGNFLTWRNLTNISRQISVTTILAFGETILIISGLLDLSSGAVMAFSGTLSVMCYKAMGDSCVSMIVAILVAIAIAVFCNALNALMVTTFRAPAFIVTLAMQAMARGAALFLTAGQNVYQIGNYTVLGQGSLWVIPIPILFMIFFFLITRYLLSDTRLGRSLYAIGGNEAAANASGIAVNKVKTMAYLVNGVMVGMAAVLFMSRVNAGLPNGAIGYETEALTTAIIGGTSFTGGIGTAGGTIVGAFIIGFLNNIMNLTSVNSYIQQIIKGAIIALAVIYDIYAKNQRTRKKMGNIEDKARK